MQASSIYLPCDWTRFALHHQGTTPPIHQSRLMPRLVGMMTKIDCQALGWTSSSIMLHSYSSYSFIYMILFIYVPYHPLFLLEREND